jgi:hypothetical protein
MDGVSMGTYLELLRVIKFVLDTKTSFSKFNQKSMIQAGILRYFATVIGRGIQRQELALQAPSFISKARPFAGVLRRKRV